MRLDIFYDWKKIQNSLTVDENKYYLEILFHYFIFCISGKNNFSNILKRKRTWKKNFVMICGNNFNNQKNIQQILRT